MLKLKCIFLLLVLGGLRASAWQQQEDPTAMLARVLQTNTLKVPQEKVHLHVDRVNFMQGENIWFKGYVVNAERNEPTTLSKAVIVELWGTDEKLKDRVLLPVTGGRAAGNFPIAEGMPGGKYKLRAYTTYMRNFSPDYFFEKTILIGNAEKATIQAPEISFPDLQFFPEGGTLVTGLESLVAFKGIGNDGFGTTITGHIEDASGKKILSFASTHLGMGDFMLTPEKGQTYVAVLADKNGKTKKYPLPVAAESGWVLSVNPLDDPDHFEVAVFASTGMKPQNLRLIAQSNGIAYHATTLKANGEMSLLIPKKTLPTGIIQFTLFSEKNLPLAQRLVFNNKNDQLKINLSALPNTTRQTEVTIGLEQLVLENATANFSIAITNASKVPDEEENEITILSNLLLTSDLKGYIEKPNYYFAADDSNKEQYLDNLLLTQGWTRFSWQKLVDEKYPEISYYPQQAMEIRGNVTLPDGKPAAGAKVSLGSISKGLVIALDTLADAQGNFVFDGLIVPDSVAFMVNASMKHKKDLRIFIDKGAAHYKRQLFFKYDQMPLLDTSVVTNASGIAIKQVDIAGAKKLEQQVNIVGSKSRNGSADYVVKKEQLAYQTGNMLSVFYSVPGVRLQEGKIVRAMANTVSMAPNFRGKPQPMLVLLDGSPIDQSVLITMPATYIEGIEVLVSNYNTAVYDDGYWGVIHITTKLGGPEKAAFMPSNVAHISGVGYSTVKEFYVPAYTVPKSNYVRNSAPALVFWRPDIQLNNTGTTAFNFDNPVPGAYKITVEGFDSLGNIGRKIYHYEVK